MIDVPAFSLFLMGRLFFKTLLLAHAKASDNAKQWETLANTLILWLDGLIAIAFRMVSQ